MNSSTSEKCSCEKESQCPQESDSSNSDSSTHKDSKKSKISLTSFGLHLRRGRSLQLRNKRTKKSSTLSSSATSYCCSSDSTCISNSNTTNNTNNIGCPSKKTTKWPLKFYCGKKEQKMSQQPIENQNCCKCTCYKRTDEAIPPPTPLEATPAFDDSASSQEEVNVVEPPVIEVSENDIAPIVEEIVPEINVVEQMENISDPLREEQSDNVNENPGNRLAHIFVAPNFIDLHWRTIGQEDVDEEARIQRAREIERGVDPPPSFRPARRVQLFCSDENEGHILRRLQIVCPHDVTMDSLRAIFQNNVTFRTCPLDVIAGCHTQVDFIHCLVPDLLNITNCSFYWGKMDRYEAERLLDGKREGTFLLRDSAQEEFLFSVSFRKYGRSLHARIEQWNHKFSFDSHDPGVYTSDTVCGLIEHYKDPSSCMFFEPVLTWPLHRNFVFSLQHLCRASIVNRLTYDDVNQLQLPKTLKAYLKEYHYRQKVRVERFDDDVQWFELRNTPT